MMSIADVAESLRLRFNKRLKVDAPRAMWHEAFRYGMATQANCALTLHVANEYTKKWVEDNYPTTYKDHTLWQVVNASITEYAKSFPEYGTRLKDR